MSATALGLLLGALGVVCWFLASPAQSVEARFMSAVARTWKPTVEGAAHFGTEMGRIAFFTMRIAGALGVIVGFGMVLNSSLG